MSERLPPIDAVLLLSFGGPEGPDDVMPFLENVTRGRGIPRERLREVEQRYLRFGGVSPLNAHCRELRAALEAALRRSGPDLPVYWGNRNWHPMLADTMARMAADGIRRAVAVATAAYSSYSACRQYLEDIERARAAVGAGAPLVEKLPPYYNHPAFIDTMAARTRDAAARLGPAGSGARLVFTAHSIPVAMAAACDYEAELREAAALVADRAAAGGVPWDLVYQSRSGPPGQPWLEPDVCDHLRALAAAGVDTAVLVPIGFVADHMEVLYDLDTEARAVADALGIRIERARTVGAAPSFVGGLRELIADHVAGRTPRALGTRGPRPS
ncbi:MAG TPA: ferrochelatase, partial [Candidatus Limnocylindria bacterium]|nr:ferrochelatase [Candidatus Limnocylindria bacterium]